MKACKDFLREHYKPKKSWKVPSNSTTGKHYMVELLEDDSFICNCQAGQMMRECRHKRRIRNLNKGLIYESEDYKRNKNKSS